MRHQVSPTKCTADQWLDVMHRAHAMGLMTTATMMFGHADTPADRIEHLRRLRDLQDESLALGRGHFTAFICWTFQSLNTQLASQNPPCQPICGSVPYLRMLATARLYLDNFANLQASWVTQGPKIGQMALFYGANDMGGLMMEENVVAAAGARFCLDRQEMRRLISEAGFRPCQRDGFYSLLE